ncbi:ArsR/SmtB family transcription factor [Rhizobium esperanzae]|uniref:DNA-binding transcriptional ArsR family regulator n=1 Tax=Rhizobium esperanzae TaxID=1967781 RepID=A0A7W6W3U8_9HYPH|nr:metalloregulator ArsR/SmtB family transcription factor [Rhizobium esperanzae]MBB4234884.1 DNA-binding transcriptional ArsR family regulator [Rhizobium esperanzae]
MDQRQALVSFAALSQETRLRIVRMLVIAGPEGMAAGLIAEKAEVSPSNVSFHLKELERSGLIDQKRESRSIIYTANYETLSGLVRFLMEDCCGGRPEICAPAAEVAACCAPASETHLRQTGAMEGATVKPSEAS